MTEKLCIAVPTRGTVTFEWSYSLRLLEVPPIPVMFTFNRNYRLDSARGLLVEEALAAGMSHILFLDDDVIPPRDALLRLWKRRRLPIVAGWCTLRSAGNYPSVWFDQGNSNCAPLSRDVAVKGDKNILQADGLVTSPELLTGLGFTLIRTEVFRSIERPFFRFEMQPDEMCIGPEDFYFMRKAKAAGFPIHVDLSVRCGHIETGVLMPDGERRQLDAGTLQGLILPKRDPAGEVAR